MNAARRKAIDAASEQFRNAAQAMRDAVTAYESARDEAKEALESARDEEQEYYDNMPESIQSGEKGEGAQSAIEAMDQVIDAIEADADMTWLDDAISAVDAFENDRGF